MSSKLTEITESSPSAPPPSVLNGSGILSRFSSPSMASSGHFDPTQADDGYKAVEVLDPACTKCVEKGKDCLEHQNPRSSKCHYCFIGKKPCCRTGKQASNFRSYLWSKKDGLLGKGPQFLRPLLLMVLQGILIVSEIIFLLEMDTDILIQ
ncbi:hypothetical protein O181_062262 [Austropuccinia psidii MF-1]|uniref:Uncharacterized protein n=1 Tax=Austropuccinia psidii MF-1 TaxID=1389203 RepID=A0A9Q3EMB7_9BASI|nr:hypothetical protein [Austropuccinia psidii MF-1]